MSLPVGMQTVTVTDNRAHPNGGPMRGKVIFRPQVATITSALHGTIVMGDAVGEWVNGVLSVTLLASDAADCVPTGWTYKVIERPYDSTGRSYSVLLAASLGPTVELSDIAPTSPANGDYVTVPGPTGPAGPTGATGSTGPTGPQGPAGADGSNANAEAYTDAAIAGEVTRADAAYETPAGATAKVATHSAASDPHGDRAAAAAALAAHEADTTAVHGIADTAALETQSGAQSKATAAQTAATTAAASALAAHEADTTSVHGIADTSALETATGATAKVSTHAGAADPHGDRVYADNKFATQVALSSLDGYVNDALTRVSAIEQGTAWLAGLQVAGNAIVSGGDLTVSDFTKGYRFRRGGSALDFEATGADMIESTWSGTGFNGTQYSHRRLASNALASQYAGLVEFVDALYGTTRHTLDGAANKLGFHGATPVTRQTVTGSRADGTAATSLLSALAALGLVVDGSTAGPAGSGWADRPADQGLAAWTYDPNMAGHVTAQSSAGVAGRVTLVRIILREAITWSNVWIGLAGLDAGASLSNCYLGVYDSGGTLKGTTADISSSLMTGATPKALPLVTPFSAAAGTYFIAMLLNGTWTTNSLTFKASGAGISVNAGLIAPNLRYSNMLTGQTSLPGSLTLANQLTSIINTGWGSQWYGVS